jgi:hypothetical protein
MAAAQELNQEVGSINPQAAALFLGLILSFS